MANVSVESMMPTIFTEIIRKRVADYIDGELKELIRQKVDGIITDVMSNLQTEADVFKDMSRYETNLVVKAIYNGQDIQQNQSKGSGGQNG